MILDLLSYLFILEFGITSLLMPNSTSLEFAINTHICMGSLRFQNSILFHSFRFLARATVGTSFYVSLCQLIRQLVSLLVSQLVRFCFSKLILGYFQIMQGAEIWHGSSMYKLAYTQPSEKLGLAVPHSKFFSQVFQDEF